MHFTGRLWDDYHTSADVPVQNNLHGSLLVLLGKLRDKFIFKKVDAHLLPADSSDRTVGNWGDLVILEEFDKFFLCMTRVDLDLVASWFDSTVS